VCAENITLWRASQLLSKLTTHRQDIKQLQQTLHAESLEATTQETLTRLTAYLLRDTEKMISVLEGKEDGQFREDKPERENGATTLIAPSS
jgi:hypothetical protein